MAGRAWLPGSPCRRNTLQHVCLPARCLAQATFGELRPQTLEHLAEEEAEAMPLMRRHFKPEEISKHVVTKVGPGNVA